jgi:predicted phosphodiesterase
MFVRQILPFIRRMARTDRSTRIVCVSDTHSNYKFALPSGDILIHAGDFSHNGNANEMYEFLRWCESQTHFRLKIIIAGNHDITLDSLFYSREWRRFHSKAENTEEIQNRFRHTNGIVYLEDQAFTDPVTGLTFYGR